MISEKERLAVKERFAEMERATQDGMTLGDNARLVIENAKDLRLSEDALMPVLRTALVINWPEKAMYKRYEQFRTQFPEISTLQDMRDVMDREDPVVFCHRYLDIKATSSANPKYCLLRELADGFISYQKKNGIATEMGALRHWAEHVSLEQLKKSDPIGCRPGVGPGVVGNIRLNLGMDAIKPDRHVIGVVQQVLGLKLAVSEYDQIARALGVPRRYFDEVAFRYGKLNKISAGSRAKAVRLAQAAAA